MKFTTRYIPLCLMLSFAGFCKPAAADLALRFSDDTDTSGANFADSFDVAVGSSLTVGIYLQQTGTDTILTDEGIVSWGFDLASTPVNLDTISNASANTTAFGSENRNVSTATGFEWEYGDPLSLGVTGNSILLGSFQFDPTAEGATIFTVSDRLVGAGFANASWLTPTFGILDEDIFGTGAADTFRFTINATAATAVPEPSSFLVLACVAGLALERRRR